MKTFLHIWLIPIILGIITAAGLVSALTEDGIWDALSWFTLSIPLIVAVYYLVKNKPARKSYK